jgi:hypothetical protein
MERRPAQYSPDPSEKVQAVLMESVENCRGGGRGGQQAGRRSADEPFADVDVLAVDVVDGFAEPLVSGMGAGRVVDPAPPPPRPDPR